MVLSRIIRDAEASIATPVVWSVSALIAPANPRRYENIDALRKL